MPFSKYMRKRDSKNGIIAFLKNNLKEIVFVLSYILLSSLILGHLQKIQFCLGENYCQLWANYAGFIFINISLGWILCYYLIAVFKHLHLSIFLKIMFPFVLMFYCLAIFYTFGTYIKINQTNYIYRANIFEPAIFVKLNDLNYIYKSGSSGDGWTYYSIKFKNSGSISITNDSVIPFLIDKLNIPFRQIPQ